MIVDTSALVAVLLKEDEEDRFARAMLQANSLEMSAAKWLEAAIIVDQRPHPGTGYVFEDYIEFLKLKIVPVTIEIGYLARVAYTRFGKGLHSARLNYDDCFSYALAKHSGDPPLFKGNDFFKGNNFAQTDIQRAVAP